VYKLYYDGACNPNPGPVGVGAVLISPTGEEIAFVSRRGADGTNNTAEYDALLAGLELALSHGVTELIALGDSKLVTMQARGDWDCNNEALYQRLMKVKEISGSFKQIHFEWIKREKNTRADELSKEALTRPLHEPVRAFQVKSNDVRKLEVKAFPGVGMAVSDGRHIFAIHFYPLSCSCGNGDACEHIKFLKKQVEQRGTKHVNN